MIIDKYAHDHTPVMLVCSPAVELAGSLHVLSNPQHHPAAGLFLTQKYDALPRELQWEIRDLGARYCEWSFVCDIMMHLTAEHAPRQLTFGESLELLRQMPEEDFAYLFLGLSAFRCSHSVLRRWMAAPQRVNAQGPAMQGLSLSTDSVADFLRDIPGMRARLIRVMEAYWEACFRELWPDIRQYFDTVLRNEETKLRRDGPLAYLQGLHPDLKVTEEEIVFRSGLNPGISLSRVRRIAIHLSVFHEPHLSGNILDDTVDITKNLNFRAVRLSASVPGSVLNGFFALEDATRLKIIRLLWNGDSTTKDMASALQLSPGTVSMHLKVMKEAGMVETTKVGKYVFYRLKKETFSGLYQQFLAYVSC